MKVTRYLLGVATIDLKCPRKDRFQDFRRNLILGLDDLLLRAITSVNKRHWKVINTIILNSYDNLGWPNTSHFVTTKYFCYPDKEH